MSKFRSSNFSTVIFFALLVMITAVFIYAIGTPDVTPLIWVLYFGLWLLFLFKPMQEVLYDNNVFLLPYFMGITFVSFKSFHTAVFNIIAIVYSYWIYNRQHKIEIARHAWVPSDDSDNPVAGMSTHARFEYYEWQHTLEELAKARTALQNLEARRKSMPEEEFESEKRYLQSKVDDWQRMSDNQYRVYKQADS